MTMDGLKHCLYGATIVSLGSLTLWTIADLWLPILVLGGLGLAAVIVLIWNKKSG